MAQVENACYWIKQVIGLVCGICFSVAPVLGAPGILMFGSLNVMLSYFTYAVFLRANLELLGPQGQWALIQEGFMPSFGLFMITWIVGYTLVQT